MAIRSASNRQDRDSWAKRVLPTTLRKGLEVLEAVPALAGSRTTIASEIARYVGMRRTSVYRYLDTLQEAGFVEQVGNGSEYRLTPRIMHIAAHYLTDLDLATQAEPVMLVQQTGLTAHLVVLNKDSIVYVHKCEPDSLCKCARVSAHLRLRTAPLPGRPSWPTCLKIDRPMSSIKKCQDERQTRSLTHIR